MKRLFKTIRDLVVAERYIVGQHAVDRLEERGIMEWQVVAGMADASLIAERPAATPNASVEFMILLPDGAEIKVVWAYLPGSGVAKLVTVHFFD